ncbi:hypothetical protein EJB05_15006, partial [Eragrostis curvula]
MKRHENQKANDYLTQQHRHECVHQGEPVTCRPWRKREATSATMKLKPSQKDSKAAVRCISVRKQHRVLQQGYKQANLARWTKKIIKEATTLAFSPNEQGSTNNLQRTKKHNMKQRSGKMNTKGTPRILNQQAKVQLLREEQEPSLGRQP